MTQTLRSPIPWIGGKHYSASHIIKAFPAPTAYNTYCEIFGGAAHVLTQKKPYRHVEVYNDINGDLVNFWMQCRDNVGVLEDRCRSLPYSRDLYYAYHYSLFDGSELEPLERAVRWFYMMRSSFSAHMREVPSGWSVGAKDAHHGSAHAYHSAIDLFEKMQQRLRYVQIDNRDFAEVLEQHNKPKTLFYADPPYITHERYYSSKGKEDSATFHERLAKLLNASPAYVALSYYPHPWLDDLYPVKKWRRVTWETPKHAQRTKDTHDTATELLLLNYSPSAPSLWDNIEPS